MLRNFRIRQDQIKKKNGDFTLRSEKLLFFYDSYDRLVIVNRSTVNVKEVLEARPVKSYSKNA